MKIGDKVIILSGPNKDQHGIITKKFSSFFETKWLVEVNKQPYWYSDSNLERVKNNELLPD